MKSVYSPGEHAIYPAVLYEEYKQRGTWPADGIEISDDDATKFNGSNEPTGKMVSMVDGVLCWVERPPKVLTKEEQVANAEAKKNALLIEAQATISLWQTELQLGIISDEDKASLIAWMNYIKAVQVVVTSKAPDIIWPEKPA
ncbi:hypothetical protein OUHCRE13_05990 [Enterobacter roggenkampii]|uniref:tail fiber assembly protein n=1 Tax=Enterobacter roggenkampii TaxID=1812935 RepID=UPI0011B9E89C|nr:tail fiber assembly protein [Enterobacter roggenkampii]TWY23549.1 tail fiber assembly protein [Enterobacter roggenkampii]